MPASRRWGDLLRLIGRRLDTEGASGVKIAGGEDIQVAWEKDGAGHGATYGELDIVKLRAQAPLMRQPISMPPKGDREELLRTLGQELDDRHVTVIEIVERPGFFEVRGTSDAGPVYRFYSLPELRALSAQRRAQRAAPTPTPTPTPEDQPATPTP